MFLIAILTIVVGFGHSFQSSGSSMSRGSIRISRCATPTAKIVMMGDDIMRSKLTNHPTIIDVDLHKSKLEEDESDSIIVSRRKLMFAAAAACSVTKAQPALAGPNENTKDTNALAPTAWQESVSGSFAGASLVFLKTLVKYPLDTASVRLQMPNSNYSIRKPVELLDNAFAGIWSPLLWNIPGGSVFFAVKDGAKTFLKASGMPKWIATCLAVFVANFPYWIIRNPSEVVKTKQQAKDYYGEDINAWEAFQIEFKENGFNGFYIGYWENIIYAYPADILKFLIYDQLTSVFTTITPLEGAVAGAFATAMAQFLTTPLDVVRNRVMTSNTAGQNQNNMITTLITMYQDEGREGLLAGASPRVVKAFLSGAIQFAAYEETKQLVLGFLQGQGITTLS